MQLSKTKVNPKLKKRIELLFCQVVSDIRHPLEAKEFLESFLTENELDMASRRLGIAYFLYQSQTYAEIKSSLGVSSATVSSIAEQFKANKRGIQIALEKIKAEEWADSWSKKILGLFGKNR
jgi:uncharacterized protein YerC